jgi:hypothetical protein
MQKVHNMATIRYNNNGKTTEINLIIGYSNRGCVFMWSRQRLYNRASCYLRGLNLVVVKRTTIQDCCCWVSYDWWGMICCTEHRLTESLYIWYIHKILVCVTCRNTNKKKEQWKKEKKKKDKTTWQWTNTVDKDWQRTDPTPPQRGRPHRDKDSNFQTEYLVTSTTVGLTPRRTEWLTVSHNVTSTSTLILE